LKPKAISMKLKKLLKGTGAKIDPLFSEADVKSIATDSRSVKKGSLFIAIKGFEFDGHDFAEEAFKKGAKAAILNKSEKVLLKMKSIIRVNDTRKALSVCARNFYRSPSERLCVAGITGTNGKTTVSHLVESVLMASGLPTGIIGTIEYRTGKFRLAAGRTTPSADSVNAMLNTMLGNGLKAAVMEVSSHALDQKRVDDILFDVAVFTNLTHEHLDYHKSLEAYFKSKAKIFSNLKKEGVAIINDDEKYAPRLKKLVRKRKITYGLRSGADVGCVIKKMGPDGSSFIVRVHKKDSFLVNTKLVGLHNISNILAAWAVGIALRIEPRIIKAGIEKLSNVKGRLEPVEMGQDFKVFVDYAHTPNALENVLGFLNGIKKRKIITLFGCGGNRDRKKRPLMGRIAQKFSDFVIITNDNPRAESPGKIACEIERGMRKASGWYKIIPDRKRAIEKALEKAKKDDIVLLAGKGHEEVQLVGKKEIPFSDKKVAERFLAR